jgi:hypothetical protein
LRTCREGCKIGPLFADDDETAQALFAALALLGNAPVYVDVPAPRPAFARFLEQGGLIPGFETTRMYLGPSPHLHEMAYGITTLELG